jgi:glyoxylase-like metal-dependent hydrolase (beta-lactamase superfamily II)
MVMVDDFADRAARPLTDGDVLQTGKHSVRFVSTPHVPHSWDAGLFFDETERTLLCSDLFFQPGDPEPMVESGIVERARDAIKGALGGPLANDMPYTPYTDSTLRRLGSSFRGDGRKALLDLAVVIKDVLGNPSTTQ